MAMYVCAEEKLLIYLTPQAPFINCAELMTCILYELVLPKYFQRCLIEFIEIKILGG